MRKDVKDSSVFGWVVLGSRYKMYNKMSKAGRLDTLWRGEARRIRLYSANNWISIECEMERQGV